MENNIKRYQITSRSCEGEEWVHFPSPLPCGCLKVSLPTQMAKYVCIYFPKYKLIQFNTNVCLSLTFVPNDKSKTI